MLERPLWWWVVVADYVVASQRIHRRPLGVAAKMRTSQADPSGGVKK